MKYIFFLLVGITIFFALSAGHITPAIVVNHDKWAHFLVFFVLSLAMNVSFPTVAVKGLIVVMFSFAIGLELVQYGFAGRELSVLDLGASVAGIFVYVSIWKIIGRKYKIVEDTSSVP